MRVIAGRLRGRTLRGTGGGATRPTSERARRGLFDWLGPALRDARVLDLFAGTGALGIEALSRGASHGTFVEQDRRACAALRRNLTDLRLEGVTRVMETSVERALRVLAAEGARFDLVLADPPYAERWLARLLRVEGVPSVLAPGASLVVQRDARESGGEGDGLETSCGSKVYGETRFDRYEPAREA